MSIRTAVIGFGVSGRIFHAPFVERNPDYSLDVIVTGNAERAEQARAEYPNAAVLADPGELFARAGQLDLIVVGTPPESHVELAETALSHGLHVIVDKPFAPSSVAAESLIARAERANRTLTVFQNRRWDGDFQTLRHIIESGELGTVYTFESRFETWKPAGARGWKASTPSSAGGGILFDLGSHLIDQAIQLFGPVERMFAHVAARGGDSAADEALLVLRHANATSSRLTMSNLAAMPAPRFHVLGSRAGYTKWGFDPQESTLRAGARPSDPGFGEEAEQSWGTLGGPEAQRRVPTVAGDYADFYQRLARALEQGTEPPVDPRSALEVLRIIERAHAIGEQEEGAQST